MLGREMKLVEETMELWPRAFQGWRGPLLAGRPHGRGATSFAGVYRLLLLRAKAQWIFQDIHSRAAEY